MRARRITVASEIDTARATSTFNALQSRYPKSGLAEIQTSAAYTLDSALTPQQLIRAAKRLTHPVTELCSITKVLSPKKYAYAVEIGFLPGVTDNVGHTARQTIEDALRRKFREGEGVYSSTFYFFSGGLSRAEVEMLARELYNPLIERATITPFGQKIPLIIPKVAVHQRPPARLVAPS